MFDVKDKQPNRPIRGVKHVVSFSGGKDSAATLGLAIERCGRENVVCLSVDTGNEHEITINHIKHTSEVLGIDIEVLKADFSEQIKAKRRFISTDQRIGRDKYGRKLRWSNKSKRRALSVLHPTGNPFLDLCLWKGRFPSRMAQFCTEELKRNVLVSRQIDIIDDGWAVVSWQGIRRDESAKRFSAKKFERLGPRHWIFRPILDWSASDVIEYCIHNGIPINDLYKQGMGRVGCMPCINVRKSELMEISNRFPEYIRVKELWEDLVSKSSKRGFSTFFHHGASDIKRNDELFLRNKISESVNWSKTSMGGVQFDLFSIGEVASCSSQYGLCE